LARRNQLGAALEQLMAYMFATAGDFEVRTNVRTFDSEHDLLVRNLSSDPLRQELGTYILVECKALAGKVSAQVVRNLVGKVATAGCRTGVLVSRMGYSGDSGKNARNARLTMIKAHQRHGVIIIPVTIDDIRQVIGQRINFGDLLLFRYEQIRFETT
jgi:predicted Mrr-cat superfamily restriction endonuclease